MENEARSGSNRIVIVGGVAAGAGAAVRARRVNETAEIVLLEAGEYISFANCGLPYYVGGEITQRQALLVQTPQQLWRRFRIRVQVQHRVTGIDRVRRRVVGIVSPGGEAFEEPYDALVLAVGARPLRPPISGLDRPNVFELRTIPDADRLLAAVQQSGRRAGRAVVVGAGFIGLEVVEALARQGLAVTLVEKAPQVLPPLDQEMAAWVAARLREQEIELVLGDGAVRFEGEGTQGDAHSLVLESGRRLEAGLFVVGLGVRPEVELARAAGLELGPTGGIRVNERMQTSDPAIFAAGDAVECPDLASGRPALFALAGPANKQGRVAGDQAARWAAGKAAEQLAPEAGRLRFGGALGTAIVRSGRAVAGITGLSERRARAAGLKVEVGYTINANHAGYYPGAKPLIIKLVWSADDGRLLGGQVVGEEGVDKRIDVLATAIAGRLRVEQLAELDLAYAPPFGAAKDPIVIAGMAAQNRRLGVVQAVTPTQLAEWLAQGRRLQLLDVRTPAETAGGTIRGAVCIPLDELRERVQELDPQEQTVVYCLGGQRSYIAGQILKARGFRSVWNLSGGYTMWQLGRAAGLVGEQSRPDVPATIEMNRR